MNKILWQSDEWQMVFDHSQSDFFLVRIDTPDCVCTLEEGISWGLLDALSAAEMMRPVLRAML